MTLSCGCEQDGSARCAEHKDWECHPLRHFLGVPIEQVTDLCPPCRIAKWRSVSLSSAATPTRRKA